MEKTNDFFKQQLTGLLMQGIVNGYVAKSGNYYIDVETAAEMAKAARVCGSALCNELDRFSEAGTSDKPWATSEEPPTFTATKSDHREEYPTKEEELEDGVTQLYDVVPIANGVKTVHFEISSANIIDLLISHNGYQGGDQGHGGFVEITVKNIGSTSMSINGEDQTDQFTLRIAGDTERDTFIQAFKLIVKELEGNTYVVRDNPPSPDPFEDF